MAGYWDDPTATEDAFVDGWCLTGDLVSQDFDGNLRFHGRKRDIIVRGGSNVSAQEVEAALYEHPAVQEAGVIGEPISVGRAGGGLRQPKASPGDRRRTHRLRGGSRGSLQGPRRDRVSRRAAKKRERQGPSRRPPQARWKLDVRQAKPPAGVRQPDSAPRRSAAASLISGYLLIAVSLLFADAYAVTRSPNANMRSARPSNLRFARCPRTNCRWFQSCFEFNHGTCVGRLKEAPPRSHHPVSRRTTSWPPLNLVSDPPA